MLREVAKYIHLTACEQHFSTLPPARQVFRIDGDVGKFDGARALHARLSPAKHRFNTQHELLNGKRLGDVIIRAKLQAPDDILV